MLGIAVVYNCDVALHKSNVKFNFTRVGVYNCYGNVCECKLARSTVDSQARL